MFDNKYLYKKEVDWSTFNWGISIPVSLQNIFYNSLNLKLVEGETKKIKIIISDKTFEGILTNIRTDRVKYSGVSDRLQIRYSANSEIVKYLTSYLSTSFNYISTEKSKNIIENKSKNKIIVPEAIKEYIYIYSTNLDDTFIFDCVTCNELYKTKEVFSKYSEIDLEFLLNNQDISASIIEKEVIAKVRKLDLTICNQLKEFYQYRCQICGELIGEKYDTNLIHAHHIEPFSISLNNNPTNIMILCPNHHGIIHSADPIYENKTFIYQNGYEEKLILNNHL